MTTSDAYNAMHYLTLVSVGTKADTGYITRVDEAARYAEVRRDYRHLTTWEPLEALSISYRKH